MHPVSLASEQQISEIHNIPYTKCCTPSDKPYETGLCPLGPRQNRCGLTSRSRHGPAEAKADGAVIPVFRVLGSGGGCGCKGWSRYWGVMVWRCVGFHGVWEVRSPRQILCWLAACSLPLVLEQDEMRTHCGPQHLLRA